MHATARCVVSIVLGSCILMPTARGDDDALAESIRGDARLGTVLEKARALAATGFSAGEGYGEVWIRDLATFIELACAVHPAETVRERLLLFFHFQQEDGNIPDGYIPRDKASVGYEFRSSESAPDYLAHKNTVETDQESSLVLGIEGYVAATKDGSILSEVVNGESVLARLERALMYVRDHRMAKEFGLVWGGTTADWGDVQPEHAWGVRLDESSHRAVDIYDNALYLAALDAFLRMATDLPADRRTTWEALRTDIAGNVRKHLWDSARGKFIPHLYLEGSPFPADFDEDAIFYHGGTTIAMQANLLDREEIQASLEKMRANVKATGAASIGLTLYPAYPEGFFKNPQMGPYSYQNGGDWTWFGGRTVRELIRHGFVADAYKEIQPMLDRVIKNDGFYEWYSVENEPRGSGGYRGSAGVLAKALEMLQTWAEARQP